MEMQTPANGQAVPQELQDVLLAPFIEAACLTLREWAGTEPVPGAMYREPRPRTLGDVSAMLRLHTAADGILVLGFPTATAQTLASRALAGVMQDVGPDMVRDCMGEVTNVVAGQAKALLHDTPYRFTFSTPTVLTGADREIETPSGADCLVVLFGSDAGTFSLQLCMKP